MKRLQGKTFGESDLSCAVLGRLSRIDKENMRKWQSETGNSGAMLHATDAAISCAYRMVVNGDEWDPPIDKWCRENIPGFGIELERIFADIEAHTAKLPDE